MDGLRGIVKTYHINFEQSGSENKLRVALVTTGVCVMVFALIEWLRHRFSVVDSLGFGIMYGLYSYFFPIKPHAYDLEVDSDGMRRLRNGGVNRVIGRDRVRYVGEWNGKILVVSEHGPIFTRLFWGGIAIPKSTPEYDEIKSLALSWL